MEFKVLVRGIILSTHPDKILLYQKKGSSVYHVPGVNVRPGQPTIECLKDYLKNRFNIDPKALYFVGVMEHIEITDHVITLFFKIDEFGDNLKLPEGNDVIYEWKLLPLAQNVTFEPEYLKEDLSRWLKGKEVFLSTKDKAFSA